MEVTFSTYSDRLFIKGEYISGRTDTEIFIRTDDFYSTDDVEAKESDSMLFNVTAKGGESGEIDEVKIIFELNIRQVQNLKHLCEAAIANYNLLVC